MPVYLRTIPGNSYRELRPCLFGWSYHCENSLAVAKYLQDHELVEWVRFPGLESDPMYSLNQKYLKGMGGSMVVFGIKGGAEAGPKFIDNLKLFSHLANVGDAKSLAIHPATTYPFPTQRGTTKSRGITPELVGLSVWESNTSTISSVTSSRPLRRPPCLSWHLPDRNRCRRA